MLNKISGYTRSALRGIGEVLYGMTIYDWVRELDKVRNEQDRLFNLIVFGDLMGIPLLPPYYTMRLIPYMVPGIYAWKRSMLRERDLTELLDHELG